MFDPNSNHKRFLPGQRQAQLPAPTWDLAPAEAASDDGEWNGLLDYARLLYKRKGTLALVLVAGILVTVAATVTQAPTYESRAALEVQGVNDNFLNAQNISPTSTYSAMNESNYVQTEAEILGQDTMIEQVVRKLKLDDLPAYQPPAKPGLMGQLRVKLGFKAPPKLPMQYAVAVAKQNLKIDPSRQSRIIRLSYQSGDPQLCADFVNTLSQIFIEQSVTARQHAAQQTEEWLSPQLAQLRTKLEKSETALDAYTRANGLMFTTGQQNLAEEKLKLLQEETTRAQADRITKQSQYSQLGPSQADTIMDAPAVRDYDSKIADLRRQLADMESLMTPENYKVVRLKAQLEQLEAARKQEVQHLQERLQNDYKSAESREQSLTQTYAHQSGVVQGLSDKITHYNNLKHEVDTNRQFYESMLQRINEAGIASAVRQSNIRLVGPADYPLKPYKPNVMFNMAMGLLVSLVLGVGLVLYQEQGNQSLQTPGEASVYLRLPELGAIPKFQHHLSLPQRLLGGVNGHGVTARMTAANGLSYWSESFRGAVTSILSSSSNGDAPHVLVLTSSLPMEGKTTVTSNLGIALAEISEKVLLIDADVRAPRLHKLFNLENKWGLSDLLSDTDHAEERPLEELVQATGSPNLFILPAGPSTENIFGLLHSDHMERLMARFRREFQYVLLDAPPCLQVADARVMAKYADGVVLVVRANHVNRKMAMAAAQRLLLDGIPVLGTILNDWDLAGSREYGYGYGYGYGKRAS